MLEFRTKLDRMLQSRDVSKANIDRMRQELAGLQEQLKEIPKEERGNIKERILKFDAEIQDAVKKHHLETPIKELQKLRIDMCEFIDELKQIYQKWLRKYIPDCSNDSLSGDEFDELGFGELVVIPGNENIWCFSCKELAALHGINPYDQSDIPEDIFKKGTSYRVTA